MKDYNEPLTPQEVISFQATQLSIKIEELKTLRTDIREARCSINSFITRTILLVGSLTTSIVVNIILGILIYLRG